MVINTRIRSLTLEFQIYSMHLNLFNIFLAKKNANVNLTPFYILLRTQQFYSNMLKRSKRLHQKKKESQEKIVHQLVIPQTSKGLLFDFSSNGIVHQTIRKIPKIICQNKHKQIYQQDSNSFPEKKGNNITDLNDFFQSLKKQQIIGKMKNDTQIRQLNSGLNKAHSFVSIPNKKITLSHINSMQFVNDKKGRKIRDLMDSQDLFSSIGKQFDSSMQEISKKKPLAICTCKKSQCLKLYCECFRKQLVCNEQCSCLGCSNREDNMNKILYVRQQYINKKGSGNGSSFSEKGCKCTKSNCLKKYCECFRNGLQCSKYCNCQDCQNQSKEGGANKEVKQKLEFNEDEPINYEIRNLDQKN